MNLLYTKEFHLLQSYYVRSQKYLFQQITLQKFAGAKKYSFEAIFPILLAIVGFCIQHNYTNLSCQAFFDTVRKNHVNAFIDVRLFNIAFNFLGRVSFAISIGLEKKKSFRITSSKKCRL